MKKFLSMLLALTLVLSLGAAFAALEGGNVDVSGVTGATKKQNGNDWFITIAEETVFESVENPAAGEGAQRWVGPIKITPPTGAVAEAKYVAPNTLNAAQQVTLADDGTISLYGVQKGYTNSMVWNFDWDNDGIYETRYVLNVPASGQEDTGDYVYITKDYLATNPGTTSPADTFVLEIEATGVTDAAEGVNVGNMPVPTISNVSYEQGAAGSDKMSQKFTIDMSKVVYTSVGVYTYTIKETPGNTAGVVYYPNEIRLVVTVVQDVDSTYKIAAIHAEANTGDGKTANFPNIYNAGSLTVSKTVTGNMGDQNKKFSVTVNFTAHDGDVVKAPIYYGVDQTILPEQWVAGDAGTRTATATIELAHGDSVTFENIPYEVTYEVVEADYTGEGYDPAAYNRSDENVTIDTAEDTVEIVNNKDNTIDTGVILETLPFVALFLVAGAGIVAIVVSKKRAARED